LRRIIEASSNEGDVVLDPFCGCATTLVAAQQLGRKWIGIDIDSSSHLLVDRLSDDANMFSDFIDRTDIPQRTDVKIVPKSKTVREQLYEEQQGKCNGCGVVFDEARHFHIDHIIPEAVGGGSYYENYQLLCGHCNQVKGKRPMEYLRMKIKAREKLLNEEIIFGE
jgi:site-specific DNA-methyltransferase (adenine-specific)